MKAKTKKEKQKYLLMAAHNAIEPWVAVAPIDADLIEQVTKLRALFQLTEPFNLNLSEIVARNISATYYQPKVHYDGSYEVLTKRPVFKTDDEQRTSCDELVVNDTEFWWRCFDHYDEMSQVINTERVKITDLLAAWEN